jgi:hypothetical protein
VTRADKLSVARAKLLLVDFTNFGDEDGECWLSLSGGGRGANLWGFCLGGERSAGDSVCLGLAGDGSATGIGGPFESERQPTP